MTVFEFIQQIADAYPDNEDIYNLPIQIEIGYDTARSGHLYIDQMADGERIVVLEA